MGYNRSHREGLNSATETDSNRTTAKGNNMKDGKIEMPVTSDGYGVIRDAAGDTIATTFPWFDSEVGSPEAAGQMLADLINAGASAPTWQPIETVPTNGRFVLVCWEGNHDSTCAARTDGSARWAFDDGLHGTTPSHWMPLPEPPEPEPEPKADPVELLREAIRIQYAGYMAPEEVRKWGVRVQAFLEEIDKAEGKSNE